MSARVALPLRIAAVGAVATLAGVVAALPAAASDGSVHVTNTESVQVYTSSTGEVQTQRVYEQLALQGVGKVDVANPISTDHLRNLDGFGSVTVKNGEQVTGTTVDGEKRYRSVSNYTGKLPLDVSVAYKLDGKNVKPTDVVGAHGRLQVTYTVKNVTARPQQVTFDNGMGGTTTRTVQVPIPIVGTLETVAPPSFTNVRSVAANMGGDGQGGTKLSFTMTLFPPIGSDTAVVGYTADITSGVVPRAEITALPVNPMASPTFKSAGGSYKGGADSGVQLAEGAATIDTNLLKLRDGAAQLLAGLIKLHDGAQQLEAGLAGQAAPGADRLATGAGQLDAGLGQIDAGSKKLASGAGVASAGSQKLAAGSVKLADGVGRLDGGVGQLVRGQHALEDGLTTLYDGVQDLPQSVQEELASNADYQSALLGLQLMVNGIGTWQPAGTAPTEGTLLGDAQAMDTAVRSALTQLDGLIAGGGLTPALTDSLTTLRTTLDDAFFQPVPADPTSHNPIQTLPPRMTQLHYGLSNPAADPAACAQNILNPQKKCGVKEVAQALLAGIPVLVDTLTHSISSQLVAGIGVPTKGCDPEATLRCGAAALSSGMDQVAAGVGQLRAGGDALAGGAGQLATGLGKLDAGAGKLADGVGQAKDGSGRLAAGARQLSSGLGDAANGSGRLADGLGQAVDGAPKLVDGAQQLSVKGTKKLVGAGKDTAVSYGETYATFKAGAQRAVHESMAYGAPKGALGLTAYSYIIQGEDGETGRNWARGLGGLALLGAGGGVFALRRRTI